MRKEYAWPKGHWDWPIHVSHKHGVRCGQMVWVGGQVDLSSTGTVQNAGNLVAQTRNAMANFERVLKELDCSVTDLVKLLCFYVDDGSVGDAAFLDMLADALPSQARPAITAIPMPYLAYPGMMVEIEGYAMLAPDGTPLSRTFSTAAGLTPLPSKFADAVRCGKMIFVSAQTAMNSGLRAHPDNIVAQTKQVMRQIDKALASFGSGFDDVVKLNRWYLGKGSVVDFEPAALACAAHFTEPGPAATGIPLPLFPQAGQTIKIEVVAMLGEDGRYLPRRHVWPESLWDWTTHLPYKHGLKCHDMVFLGGQVSLDNRGCAVNPGDMRMQTAQAMVHIGTILRELGADYSDVCKITTFYQGRTGADELHDNLSIRSSYFTEPGPATTGIPFPVLAYPAMVIEIEAFAMADPG